MLSVAIVSVMPSVVASKNTLAYRNAEYTIGTKSFLGQAPGVPQAWVTVRLFLHSIHFLSIWEKKCLRSGVKLGGENYKTFYGRN